MSHLASVESRDAPASTTWTGRMGQAARRPSRILATLVALHAASPSWAVDSDLTVSAPALGSTIVVRTSSRFDGAVYSLVFRNKEHIDSNDHGRLLQSASSFDDLGECFNPTEGGSLLGSPKESTSVVEAARVERNELWTRTDMGFWLNPGTPYPNGCGGNKARTRAVNTEFLSHHVLEKHITVGMPGFPNVLHYEVAFHVPSAYRKATFEALTGYMPKDFSRAIFFDVARRAELDPGTRQGEQRFPVILATPDGAYAMGVYSPSIHQNHGAYGRFDFGSVKKWNCVFRMVDIKPQAYRFQSYVVLGTVREVEDTIVRLDAKFEPKPAAAAGSAP